MKHLHPLALFSVLFLSQCGIVAPPVGSGVVVSPEKQPEHAAATKAQPFVNSLGMKFVPAGSPGVLFSVWETRVRDFEAFVEESGHDAVSENRFGSNAYTLEKNAEGFPDWEQKGGSWRDPRFPAKQTEEHPVVCVSYLDAEAFCEWLTKRERTSGKIPAGASYRLPTDSEWSRACGPEEFPWGEHYPPRATDGNYFGTEAMVGAYQELSTELSEAGFRDSAARTGPVGIFAENRFGLYDMGGNVFEWCSTWYTADLNDEETKKTVPLLADDQGGQTYRVLRGSAWGNCDRGGLRSSFRTGDLPMGRRDILGFRCVLVVAGGKAFMKPKAHQDGSPGQKPMLPGGATTSGKTLDQGGVGKAIQVKLPGDVLMKFGYCPPGSFMMGSPASEQDRNDVEDQAQVRLSKGFWMGQTEVTQGQWAAVMGSNPSTFTFQGDDLPVEMVRWKDAQAFITKLNQLVPLPGGWKYALPTEAQWEYACRAGTESVFSFGDVLNGREANCDGNEPYGTSTKGPYLEKTAKVGSYAPNAWGLYDMHGNVYEWCEDAWDGSSKLPGGTDPLGTVGSNRVYRGGCWINSAPNCRAASRDGFTPAIRYNILGFRVAAVLAGAR